MKKLVLMTLTLPLAALAGADYPYAPAALTNVTVTGGFWLPRVETNRLVTVRTDFEKCELARIPNFRKAAARMKNGFKGEPYDDSDLYKVIEGAAYTLATHPDPKLEAYVDGVIDAIAGAQERDGYLYTARTLGFVHQMMGPTRWSNCREGHELYNVGHLYEAAVAYAQATGKRKLLDVARRSADLVDRTFGPGAAQLKVPPGHEEIELALVKLFRATGEVRYLELSKTLIDFRGRKDLHQPLWGSWFQDHKPVREQREAVGHAVRASYLYSAMTDLAVLAGDRGCEEAVDALWQNIVGRKLHLTGGIGARADVRYADPALGEAHEAFGDEYDLPNEEAYLETCAAVGNALWNERLFLMRGEAKYIDVLERVIYNGFLSGISLGGNEFFYQNPLASRGKHRRSKWFGCSCCPVNVVRFIPQIAPFAYATRGDAAYVNLFVESDATLNLACGDVKLSQRTDYPWRGDVRIAVEPPKDGATFTLNIRIPGWCVGRPVPSNLYVQTEPGTMADFKASVNGKAVPVTSAKGYCAITRAWKKGDTVEVAMNMPVRRIKANGKVKANRGRLAVERGPIVYCAEGVDNGGSVLVTSIAADAPFSVSTCDILGNVYPALTVPALQARRDVYGDVPGVRTTLTLVPYFAWCHRGAGEMQTWFPVEPPKTGAPTDFDVRVSHCFRLDTLAALFDNILPESSTDTSIPRHTFFDHRGTDEWVEMDFPRAEEISGVEVYWFDDEPVRGECRLPAEWTVEWRESENAPWRKVAATGEIAKDRFCRLTFPERVKARGIRIAVKLREGFSGGILEIRFPAANSTTPGHNTLISHRGESVDAPENTLPAYRMAVERGFGFECDVYLSKDGRVFTLHDRDLRRITGGANTKRCCDVTWADLEKVDVGNWGKWRNSRFKGTRPALLEEVLELARDGRWIYVEVKPGPKIVPYIKDIFAAQSKATPANTLFISFNEETCKALKAQMPQYKVLWLSGTGRKTTPEYFIAKCRELGVDGIDVKYNAQILTAGFVKKVRDAGLEFHVFTVDKLEDTMTAFSRGIQTVTTNCAKNQLDELTRGVSKE